MKLYHVTSNIEQALDYTFIPRVPKEENTNPGEDLKTNRICFSDSIKGCITAMPCGNSIEGSISAIVYELEVDEKDKNVIGYNYLYENNMVSDAALTHEYWYLKEVNIKGYLAVIEILDSKDMLQIDASYKEKIVKIIKGLAIYSEEIDGMNCSDILNEWLPRNHPENFEAVKNIMVHEEINPDYYDDSLDIWEIPRGLNKKLYEVSDYMPLRVITKVNVRKLT